MRERGRPGAGRLASREVCAVPADVELCVATDILARTPRLPPVGHLPSWPVDRRLLEPVADWALEDVQALVDERIAEGQRLDYKQELPLERDKDRAELAKDISGMANAQGGLLIYGVAEDDSDEPRPVGMTPLPRAGQQTRVEDILDSTVHPRLDYSCRTLDAGEGCVLVVRVAPRAGGPHMVQGYKQHRYFIRRGTRTLPMSEDEVRAAYEAARTRADKLGELLTQLPLLPRIGRARSVDQLRMTGQGVTPPEEWLPLVSVVTAPFDAGPELISPAHVSEQSFPEPFDRFAGRNRGLRARGRYSVDALGLIDEALAESSDEQPPQLVLNRLRIYRQGVCEWAHRYSPDIPEPYAIPSSAFAWDVHNAFTYFASIYDAVGYAGRLAVFVRIDNADKATLGVNQRLTDFPRTAPAAMESINAYRETTVDALLADPLVLVRDAMQLIWQAFGYPRCLLFDTDGRWVLEG
jgi:hypothetical protein